MIRRTDISNSLLSYFFESVCVISFLLCCCCFIVLRLLIKPMVFVFIGIALLPIVLLELFRKQ